MIFDARQAHAILDGRKTQHRIHNTGPIRLKPGHDYPIQTRTGTIGRFRVLEIRETTHGDLTYQDARALGFRYTGLYKMHWVQSKDKAWCERHPDAEGPELARRFDERWAGKPVFVLTIQRVVDQPRFLTAARDAPTHGDYTQNRARAADDLECVDEWTQSRISAVARAARLEAQAVAMAGREKRRRAKKAMRVGRAT
jgi:hypothetical protein